ncbi:MAG: response regulator [Polyangiales bacterium]
MPERRRVLLADDDDDLREIVGAVLAESGFEVVYARNGREALDCARSAKVDVMVIDQRMPGLLGTEVAAELREGGDALPIVLVTAAADMQALASDAHIRWVVGKPFSIDELIEAVERATQRSSSSFAPQRRSRA